MHRPRSNRLKHVFTVWLVCTFASAVSGCGTIFSGTHQNLKLNMDPPGTELEVYRWSGDRLAGPASSPGKLEVHRPVRSQSYLVRAAKPGYCPKYWITSSGTTPGVYTYIWMMFIPALGPIIVGATAALFHASTGGCCSVEPDTFGTQLAQEATCPE